MPGHRLGLRCRIAFVLCVCFLPHSLPCSHPQIGAASKPEMGERRARTITLISRSSRIEVVPGRLCTSPYAYLPTAPLLAQFLHPLPAPLPSREPRPPQDPLGQWQIMLLPLSLTTVRTSLTSCSNSVPACSCRLQGECGFRDC